MFSFLSLLFLAPGPAPNEQLIDGFSYTDRIAAARAWVSSTPGTEVDVVREGSRRVLQLKASFSSTKDLPRTIHDRQVRLDLAVPGEFTLELAVEKPEAIGQVSLYFRSGDGWFAGASGLHRKGWQTLHFPKSSFQVEGQPAGWHRIDGIRLSFWAGQAADSWVRLGRLSAAWHQVTLVLPSLKRGQKDPELRGARRTADNVAAILADLGLGADAIDEDSLPLGALARHRVAILAHNPTMGPKAVEALVRFVEQGGKLFVCYQLPPALESVLGFGKTRYLRPEALGQFSEIRFDVPLPGLPPRLRQHSWNITTAQPLGHNARVLGKWFDEKGRPTGEPALLLSDRGVFFSHILIAEDRETRKQFLAALLGQLEPPLWEAMAQGELSRLSLVGHLEGTEALAVYVKQRGNPAASEQLTLGRELAAQARKKAAAKDFAGAVSLAQEAHGSLVRAYLLATPSRAPEGRAFWEHSGTGAYPGDWERTARELQAGGFNMIVPNLLWGGTAHYASDLLPRSDTFRKLGDQIEQCLRAAHRHGLEVHVWKVNYNLANAPRSFLNEMRSQGRTQVSARGEPLDWLCPSHPDNFQLERDSMLEVARKYKVNGLHFDYIRYPHEESCFCNGCRQRFERDSGKPVPDWPGECHQGARKEEYRTWRCRQITQLVEAVSREARKIRPNIKISAAVFGSYPSCRQTVGQDWPAWVKAGYLDFLCPMDYTESALAFSGLVENQLKLVGGRIPVYPGIGATASRSALTVDQVVNQILAARSLGAGGFTIFNLDRNTINSLVPGVGLGVGSKPARPLHRR